MTDLYRPPVTREETLTAELVLVVPVTEPVYRIDRRKGFPTEIEEALEDEWLVELGEEER